MLTLLEECAVVWREELGLGLGLVEVESEIEVFAALVFV